jgi:hypothetical protein
VGPLAGTGAQRGDEDAEAWTWTGYQGNTLWDWLQLLLLPLVFPTILLPALLKWISGNPAERASREAEAAKERSGSSPAVSQPKA